MARSKSVEIEDIYALKFGAIWRQFQSEHFSFWMICCYLFVEYVRPQSIIPAINILPWAQFFILLSFGGWLIDPQRKGAGDPANKWIILFFCTILLSSYMAYRPDFSYPELNKFYTWLIIYFLIINIVNTRPRFFIFLGVFVIASFKISLSLAMKWAMRGFSFTSWGLMGPPGFFQNSGELAIQMAVFFPIAFTLASFFKPVVSKKMALLLALMPITAVLTILGSSSRGGQVALAIQLVAMFWRNLIKPKVLIGAIISGVILFSLVPEEQKARFASAGNDGTSQQRLLYWKHGVEMIKAHPLLGVGYFNFVPYYHDYYGYDSLRGGVVELPHNIFIQVGTDAGLLGLFIFVAMMYRTVRANTQTARGLAGAVDQKDVLFRRLAFSLNIALLGFVAAGQFVTVAYYPFMWINLALTVALHRSTVATDLIKDKNKRHSLSSPKIT